VLLVYNNLGDGQQALTYYRQALPIRREVGDRAGEAGILNNIGAMYNNLAVPQDVQHGGHDLGHAGVEQRQDAAIAPQLRYLLDDQVVDSADISAVRGTRMPAISAALCATDGLDPSIAGSYAR
jgi:hypothetical protein